MFRKRIIGMFFFLIILAAAIISAQPVYASVDSILDYEVKQDFNGASDAINKTEDLAKVRELRQGSILVKFKSVHQIPMTLLAIYRLR